MRHNELKEKALQRKGVNAEYKSLEPEFALLRAIFISPSKSWFIIKGSIL
jgi:hypothetical protein